MYNETGITLQGLEEVRKADQVFIETYTNLMPDFSLHRLVEISGKRIVTVSRNDLESQSKRFVEQASKNHRSVLLIPGDPLIATTHVALRIEAEKHGIKTRIIHGASIISAAIGLSGLHSYKFGKSVTIPLPEETACETPYDVIVQNRQAGLHTLCFLDIAEERDRFLSINEAIEILSSIDDRRRGEVITGKTLAVGIARAGSPNALVRAGKLDELMKFGFGGPPQTLVFPARLHFMEAEALIVLAGASADVRGDAE